MTENYMFVGKIEAIPNGTGGLTYRCTLPDGSVVMTNRPIPSAFLQPGRQN